MVPLEGRHRILGESLTKIDPETVPWRRISLSSIRVGDRIRSNLGDLTGLKNSIKKVGLLNPICVDADFNLIHGRRRLEVCRQLGWEEVECTILPLDSFESKLAELHENMEREDLIWQDEVRAKAEIDRMYREIHGSARERQRTDLLTGSESDPVPWSYKRTADLLNESKALIIEDIQLAEAFDQYPGLEEFKYKSQAKSRLRENRREEERIALLSEAGPLGYKVYQADNTDMIESGSIDLIVTDPPMFLSHYEEIDLPERAPMRIDKGPWDHTDNPMGEFGRWAEDFHRVLKEGGSLYVFVNDHYISHLRDALEEAGLTIRTLITWHKTNPAPKVRRHTYCMSTEHIWFATKGSGHTFNWQGQSQMHNFIEVPIVAGAGRLHPTQKPVPILKKWNKISSNPGDIVLDPFAGSGSTGVAALELGRDFALVEKERQYVDIIRERLIRAAEGAAQVAPNNTVSPCVENKEDEEGLGYV